MASTALVVDEEFESELELHNDNGLVYQKRKRRRSLEEEAEAEASTTASQHSSLDLQKHLKKRRLKTLDKILDRYQKEISQWELLSNTLDALEESAKQHQITQQQQQKGSVDEESTSQSAKSRFHKHVDELIKQVEIQDAIFKDVEMLCDMAEVMLDAEEEQRKKQFFDLPVWNTSPKRIFATLCEEDECSDNDDT